MESNKNVTEQSKTTGGTANKPSITTGQSSTGTSGHASSAPQRARDIASDVGSGVQTAYDQTIKAVGEAYEKTSEVHLWIVPARIQGAWCGTGNSSPLFCNTYNPPGRNWDYDTDYQTVENLPPLTPRFVSVQQILFTENFR